MKEWLYRHGGRFIAVPSLPRVPRVCLDPVGSLGAVSDPEREILASTTSALPDHAREGLAARLAVNRTNNLYPVGLPPRGWCAATLADHLLDLSTRTARRHWPTASITPI